MVKRRYLTPKIELVIIDVEESMLSASQDWWIRQQNGHSIDQGIDTTTGEPEDPDSLRNWYWKGGWGQAKSLSDIEIEDW